MYVNKIDSQKRRAEGDNDILVKLWGQSNIIVTNKEMEIKVLGNENEIYVKDKLLGEGAFGKAYLVNHK